MADRHIESFNEMYPTAFWCGYTPSLGETDFWEMKMVVAAFKLWAQAQPSMPRTVSGNTKLFEAFKQGWLEEKAKGGNRD